MEVRKQLQMLWSQHSRWVLITTGIVMFGILLRALPDDFILVKPFRLFELDLQDLRTEGRTWLYNQWPFARIQANAPSESPIALILIHEREFAEYGFPPARDAVADVVTALKSHGAKVIAFDMTFELERDAAGTAHLARESQRAGNVIYPITLTTVQSRSRIETESNLPTSIKNKLNLTTRGDGPKTEMMPARLPQDSLLKSVTALGHIRAHFDMDGKIRRVPLVLKGHNGRLYPSLSLMAVCLYHGIPKEGVIIEWGKRIVLDNHQGGNRRWHCEIPIDSEGQMHVNYTKRMKDFPNRYAFADVHRAWRSIPGLHEQPIQLEAFEGKVVFIGYLEERSEQTPTPFELQFPGVAVHATIVENMLQHDFVQEASWWIDAIFLSLFTGLMMFSQAYPYRFTLRERGGIYSRLTLIAAAILCVFAIFNFIVFNVTGWFLNVSLPLFTMALAWSACYIQKIREQKAYNELILANMGNGLIVLDNQGKVTALNQKAAELFDLSDTLILGKLATGVFENDLPEVANRLTKALEGSSNPRVGYDRFSIEIGNRTLEVSLSDSYPISGNSYRLIAVVTDVTELRYLQHQATKAELDAQLNHRLSNELQTIISTINPLKRRIKSSRSNEALDCVAKIERQADKLKELADNFKHGISTYQQIEGESWREANLNEAVCTVLKEISRTINDTIKVVSQLSDDRPLIQMKPYWITDALRNLVNNAIDAMPCGGTLTITTELMQTGKVRLSVSDTGEGIPDEHREKIFTQWYTTKEKGNGMGLYMVKLVMMVHNGEVFCESQLGKGTTFHLLFPTTQP